jgi:hypothetical protein
MEEFFRVARAFENGSVAIQSRWGYSHTHMRLMPFITILLFCRALYAGEVIVHESFDALDIKNLPLGYSVFGQDFAVVADTAQGKALKISQRTAENPEFSIHLDLNKVAGHTVRVLAFVRVPVEIKPVDGKPDAQPELKFITKDHAGADKVASKNPLASNREWQRLSILGAIDKDAAAASVNVGLKNVAGEVLFAKISVEVDPDTRLELLAEAAAKAPVRKGDMSGITFGPDIAEAMQKGRDKSKAIPNTLLFAGPGLPVPELEAKLPAGWTAKNSKELDAPPRTLLALLAESLGKEKPEVVFLIGDGGSARKLAALERVDWEDLARLSLRLGAVPVLVTPALQNNDDKDVLRGAMLRAAEVAHCPVMELGAANANPARLNDAVQLVQKYILARDAKGNSGPKHPDGKVQDE